MLLKNVIGQEHAKKGLLDMYQSGHLPHALLLVGDEGYGGLPLAWAFIQYVLCEQKQASDACGICPNCSKISKWEHADVHLSFPSIKLSSDKKNLSKYHIDSFKEFVAQTPYGTCYDWLQFIDADNKQGNISKDECDEIIHQMSLKSYEGGIKVQVIWLPEYLGKEGNRLLKLIEEPPADTLFVLIANNKEEVMPTIVSRTQVIPLVPIPAKQLYEELIQKGVADPSAASQIAQIAKGSYAEALHLAKQLDNDLFTDLRNWFNALFAKKGADIVSFVEEYAKKGREQQKNFLHYVIAILEQAIKARYVPENHLSLPASEKQFVVKLAGMQLSIDQLQQMIKEINDTQYAIERNAHSKTQLHALSISLQFIIQNRKWMGSVY